MGSGALQLLSSLSISCSASFGGPPIDQCSHGLADEEGREGGGRDEGDEGDEGQARLCDRQGQARPRSRLLWAQTEDQHWPHRSKADEELAGQDRFKGGVSPRQEPLREGHWPLD